MLDLRALVLTLFGAVSLVGCSSEPLDDENDATAAPPVATEAVSLTQVYEPNVKIKLSATSLAFNAAIDGELWVALRQFPSGLPCTLDDDSGCAALPGVMAVISDAPTDTPSAVLKEDGNAWHFMRRPTAVAWGDEELFASCGEALTDNYEDVDIPYAGPVLWSSDPSIFGVTPLPSQNGTHIDMLHETPRCMGIAHESGNVFWAFNGDAGSLDRVDFHHPHAVGGEDHDDGEVHRYIAGQLSRVPEVPSHLAYDAARQLVYVADTGHARVLSVDPSTATAGDDIDVYEVLQASGSMNGAAVRELVRPGTLQSPSGLALSDDKLYVTDNATSLIHVYDVSGKAERVLDTGLPTGSLAGIVVGPDQKLYITDLITGRVQRVEASGS